MDLQPYVDGVRHELGVAAAAGGADAQALADRLTAPLDSAIRLALLEALSDAASEITRELAPGSVDVRLRGREPEFVVTAGVDDEPEPVAVVPESDDDSGTWRVTLRLPESLRSPVDAAARAEGLSVNAWLVRAVASALGGRRRREAVPTSISAAGSADRRENNRGEHHADIRHTPADHGHRRDRQRIRPSDREDRDDTVVTVSPRDPNRASDVRVAESARVDFTNGTLTVTAGRRIISLGRGGAVIVDIELPSRSRLQVSSASAKLRADGDFGECRLSTASGDAAIDIGHRKLQVPTVLPARSPSIL